ncbi:MAG: M24 family metallopeptidase [Planctomycetales bacterium]|nr:M24 family metallopeptidase [Planctomycetales bacterium]
MSDGFENEHMSSATIEAARPVSSGEFFLADPAHFEIVELRQKQVAEFLKSRQCDAMLLQRPWNFSWFTAGGSSLRFNSSDVTAALFLTPDSRVIVTSGVDSGQIFDREVSGLGFQIKERPWHQPRNVLIEDLCRGRRVLSDCGFPGTKEDAATIDSLRLPLQALECERLTELGKIVAHAVEATARHVEPGQSESEIAGEVAHRLMKHEVVPIRIQVMADGRSQQYRHWGFNGTFLKKWCVISAMGRRQGLHVSATRTVCFGHPSERVADAHRQAAMVQATGMFFSQPRMDLGGLSDRIQRIYEKFIHVEEWQRADQAEVIGYQACEAPVVPLSQFRLAEGMAIFWHCSVGPAALGDTLLITNRHARLLTSPEQWPLVRVDVKGRTTAVPDILCREVGSVLD